MATLLLLGACSPTLNWREVRVAEAGLVALLPCKPERTTRTVQMGGQALQMHMVGCEAAGATLAVAYAPLPPGMSPAQALEGWRSVVQTHVGATAEAVRPYAPQGAAEMPQSVRLTLRNGHWGQRAVQGQAAWFARIQPDAAMVYHAVVYADEADLGAMAPLFDEIRFQ